MLATARKPATIRFLVSKGRMASLSSHHLPSARCGPAALALSFLIHAHAVADPPAGTPPAAVSGYGLALCVNGQDYAADAADPVAVADGQSVFAAESCADLTIARKLFVAPQERVARWLSIVRNDGDAPRTANVRLTARRSQTHPTVVVASADGDILVSPADTWAATAESGGDAESGVKVFVVQGPAAPTGVESVVGPDGGEALSWTYSADLAPGETMVLMHFVSDQPDASSAQAIAESLVGASEGAIHNVEPIDALRITNFALDSDEDAIANTLDNCPFVANPDQHDADFDKHGDACDACASTPAGDAVDADGCSLVDEDGDGVLNDADRCHGTPRCARPIDADGCPVDADADGNFDGCDLCPGSDDLADADGDAIPDCLDACPMSGDSDADGVDDCLDGCPSDPAKLSPGACGCGVSDADTDADTVPDCLDLAPGQDDLADADGDGIRDLIDNCPDAANADQLDTNANGLGDVCEAPPVGRPNPGGVGAIVDPDFLQQVLAFGFARSALCGTLAAGFLPITLAALFAAMIAHRRRH